jgi:hypothetical protein
MGDDVVKGLETLFQRSESDLIRDTAGRTFLKSATGTPIGMTQIQHGIELVLSGKNVDEVANMFPRKLENGTDFRNFLVSELKKAKPNSRTSNPHIPNPTNLIDIGDYITRQFPEIRNNSNIFNSLVIDAQRQLQGKNTAQQVTTLKQMCIEIHSGLQTGISRAVEGNNPKLADKLREMDRSVSVISKWLKNLGPLSFNEKSELNPIKSIFKAAGWLFGAAVVIDAIGEYSEGDGDLWEYMTKYLIKKGKRGIAIIFLSFKKDGAPSSGNEKPSGNKKPRPY